MNPFLVQFIMFVFVNVLALPIVIVQCSGLVEGGQDFCPPLRQLQLCRLLLQASLDSCPYRCRSSFTTKVTEKYGSGFWGNIVLVSSEPKIQNSLSDMDAVELRNGVNDATSISIQQELLNALLLVLLVQANLHPAILVAALSILAFHMQWLWRVCDYSVETVKFLCFSSINARLWEMLQDHHSSMSMSYSTDTGLIKKYMMAK